MDTINQLLQLLRTSFSEFVQTLTAYLPNLATALLLLILGWAVASLVRWLINRFGTGIDRLTGLMRKEAPAATAPTLGKPPSGFIASLAYWLVIVFFVAAAVEPLGLPGLAEWLGRLIIYLPQAIIGGLIIVVGYFLSSLAQDLVRGAAHNRGMASAEPLGLMTRGLIIVFSAILGIGQLGLDITLLVNVATIAAAAVLGGLGLAFGVGASQQVGNILASHHVRKNYRIGQRVRINEIEGDILELSTTAVVLDTEKGRALIPAKLFNDQVSLLIPQEDRHG